MPRSQVAAGALALAERLIRQRSRTSARIGALLEAAWEAAHAHRCAALATYESATDEETMHNADDELREATTLCARITELRGLERDGGGR